MRRHLATAVTAVIAALAAAVASGCQELPEVPAGTCGNFVLEVGEDCEASTLEPDGSVRFACGAFDGPNPCLFECEFRGALGCPTGYACGVDGRCRQPSGRFVLGASSSLLAEQFAIADVDGDGSDDLVAASGASLEIAFGSIATDLGARVELPLTTPASGLAAADLDGDLAADVVVATGVGAQAFLGAADRVVDPFSYPLVSFGPAGDRAVAIAVRPTPSAATTQVLVAWADQLGFPVAGGGDVRVDLPDPDGAGPQTPSAGALAPLVAARFGVARGLDPALDPSLDVVVGYPGQSRLFVFEIRDTPLRVDAGASLDLGVTTALAAGSAPVTGHFDGDACVDLLVHTAGAVQRLELLRGTPGGVTGCTGALQAPTTLAVVAGASARLLAAADLDGDGVTDVVTDAGIFRVTGTGPWTLTPLVAAADPYAGATVVDLNGDGRPDVAAFRADGPDVEVQINAGDAFNRFVVSTAGTVEGLATGDFDGDLTPDLAIVEVDASGDATEHVVSVSFGSFQGPPSPAQVMDRYPVLAGVTAARVAGAGGAPDAADDLVVLEPSTDELMATVLFGSGARTMTSPLLLTAGVLHVPRAVAVGRFTADAAADLWALGSRGDVDGLLETSFLFAGDGTGAFVDPVDAPWPPGFATRDALWALGDLDDDGVDEIAAVEARGAAVQIAVFSPDAVTGEERLHGVLDDATGGHALVLVDGDGDGDRDLFVAAMGATPRIVVSWNRGGTLQPLEDLPGGQGCVDVEVAQLDGDVGPEVVLLCKAPADAEAGPSLELRFLNAVEPETLLLDSRLLGSVPGGATAYLDTGDVNGDGLADLIVRAGGAAADIRLLVQRDIHSE